MKSKHRLLWITDPWDTLDHPKDTTLRLMEESLKAKLESFWCDVRSIRLDDGDVFLTAKKLTGIHPDPRGRASDAFHFAPEMRLRPRDFSRLFYRTDPPIDHAYTLPLQLLAQGLEDARAGGKAKAKGARIVNEAALLLGANEKTFGAALAGLFPRGVVSSRLADLLAFLARHPRAVAKPLYGAQSVGVKTLDAGTQDAGSLNGILREMTQDSTVPIILQEFLPGIADGEQRLWFVNGRLIGHVRKVPKAGEAIIDMDRGGSLRASKLNATEKKAAAKIGAFLKKRRIAWAAVDLIDGKVTDFNFTSPGLLVGMEDVLGVNLAKLALAGALGR